MSSQNSSWIRLTLIILLFTLLIGVVPTAAQQAPLPEAVGQRPDAPTYALHGQYWVGTQTLEMFAGTDDAIRFTIWYPALNPEGAAESVAYVLSENHTVRHDLGISPDEPFTVLGHALADAAPDSSNAPYPLVINSHGFTAQMWQMYLGEHLASYGFVVIAPEHSHDSWDNPLTDMVTRILEVERTIDYAVTMTAPDGLFPGLIDTSLIGMGGHSSGGMTAYGSAGAPLLWTGVQRYCEQVPDDPECADLVTQFEQINTLLGTDAAVDELLPVVENPRVDAIFPMSGSMEPYDQQGLEAITVPMMTLYGSADPVEPWFNPAYDAVSSVDKAEVIFRDGGHGIFYNQCEAFDYIVKYGFYWGCSDPVWDMGRTQDLTNHFITAFLLDELKSDADAHTALLAENAVFPGITYQTTLH